VPIETWQAYKPAEADLQHRGGQQIAHGDNIALQHTLGGDPMSKGSPVNAGAEGASPAARFNSTAPYKDPTARSRKREKRCRGNDDTCMGWATATGFCMGHSQSNLRQELFEDD